MKFFVRIQEAEPKNAYFIGYKYHQGILKLILNLTKNKWIEFGIINLSMKIVRLLRGATDDHVDAVATEDIKCGDAVIVQDREMVEIIERYEDGQLIKRNCVFIKQELTLKEFEEKYGKYPHQENRGCRGKCRIAGLLHCCCR